MHFGCHYYMHSRRRRSTAVGCSCFIFGITWIILVYCSGLCVTSTTAPVVGQMYIPLVNLVTQYLGLISVGTPPQMLTVTLDTGSSDSWLISDACVPSICHHVRPGMTSFKWKKSSTFSFLSSTQSNVVSNESTYQNATLSYGSGSVTGRLGNDKICFGDAEYVCINHQALLLVESEIGDISSVVSDAVVGLGWPELCHLTPSSPSSTVLSELMQPGVLQSSIFSFNFGADVSDDSYVTFGYIDSDYVNKVIYSPLLSVGQPGFWRVGVVDIRVGGTSIGCSNTYPSASDGCHAVVDSGTTYLGLPPHLYAQVVSHLSLNRDCSNMLSLPSLLFSLPVANSNLKVVDLSLSGRDLVHQFGVSECVLAVQLTHEGIPPIILGGWFFKKYYAVFDMGERQVGFAVKRNETMVITEWQREKPIASVRQVANGNRGATEIISFIFLAVLLIGFVIGGVIVFRKRRREGSMMDHSQTWWSDITDVRNMEELVPLERKQLSSYANVTV